MSEQGLAETFALAIFRGNYGEEMDPEDMPNEYRRILGDARLAVAGYTMSVADREYFLSEPETGWKREFTDAEKAKLRPMAETLAMLDGNAFFTMGLSADGEWYEQYLPEAHALYEANGGDAGWAGQASFARAALNDK